MTETKNPWHYISKEGYPKKEGRYLVASYDKSPSFSVETFYTNMMKASYDLPHKKGFCYYDSEWGTGHDDCVFAWMDIPELPTRKELENERPTSVQSTEYTVEAIGEGRDSKPTRYLVKNLERS